MSTETHACQLHETAVDNYILFIYLFIFTEAVKREHMHIHTQ
jgi:hypothetical protein